MKLTEASLLARLPRRWHGVAVIPVDRTGEELPSLIGFKTAMDRRKKSQKAQNKGFAEKQLAQYC